MLSRIRAYFSNILINTTTAKKINNSAQIGYSKINSVNYPPKPENWKDDKELVRYCNLQHKYPDEFKKAQKLSNGLA